MFDIEDVGETDASSVHDQYEPATDIAGTIEQYRQSTDRDIRKFFPPAKRLYYQAEEYYAQDKYAEAESFYKQAIAFWEKSGDCILD